MKESVDSDEGDTNSGKKMEKIDEAWSKSHLR